MKNLKILLPMLAFVFAIGVAFATVDLKEEPPVQPNDYILVNGSWFAIDEQECEGLEYECTVRQGPNGPVFKVYDEMSTATLKRSSSNSPVIIYF